MADKWWGSRKATQDPRVMVLRTSLIKKADLERCKAVQALIDKPADAYKLQGHDGFSYQDLKGDCGLVRFNPSGGFGSEGIAILLLKKADVVEIPLGPMDPLPEHRVTDPDVWHKFDLVSTDAHVATKGIAANLREAMKKVDSFRLLWTNEKTERRKAEEELASYEAERKYLLPLPITVAQQKEEISRLIDGTEALVRQLRDEREGRRLDRIETMKELFPLVNTIWLAGIHKVEDKLYGILSKQMTDALGKIGIDLVDPAIGTEFNPELHHAIHAIKLPIESKQIGQVLQVHRVGWRFGSMIISAADVSVGIETDETSVSVGGPIGTDDAGKAAGGS